MAQWVSIAWARKALGIIPYSLCNDRVLPERHGDVSFRPTPWLVCHFNMIEPGWFSQSVDLHDECQQVSGRLGDKVYKVAERIGSLSRPTSSFQEPGGKTYMLNKGANEEIAWTLLSYSIGEIQKFLLEP
jgi:hypothetical protein